MCIRDSYNSVYCQKSAWCAISQHQCTRTRFVLTLHTTCIVREVLGVRNQKLNTIYFRTRLVAVRAFTRRASGAYYKQLCVLLGDEDQHTQNIKTPQRMTLLELALANVRCSRSSAS